MAWKILVLEDDATMRQALVLTLRDEDYQVREAASAEEALRLARRVPFHLVVTDVRMAGMDGLEFLDALGKIRPGTRSIVITGYADESAPGRAIRAQADDYLYKPFHMRDFLTAVSRVLNAKAEQERYNQLLGGILSGYRKLMDAAGTALANAQLASLENLREGAFRAFYVGVRSGKLGQSDAMKLWDRLEQHEAERDELKVAGIALKKRQALASGYQYLTDLIGAMSREHAPYPAARASGGVAPNAFKEFYQRILRGVLTPQQVRLAPYLRGLEPAVLDQSSELKSLHQEVWGVPAGSL